MSETVHQEQTTQTAAQPERTFTQAEMDAIIGDRLNRERQKYADYAELKAKALKFDEAENASRAAKGHREGGRPGAGTEYPENPAAGCRDSGKGGSGDRGSRSTAIRR